MDRRQDSPRLLPQCSPRHVGEREVRFAQDCPATPRQKVSSVINTARFPHFHSAVLRSGFFLRTDHRTLPLARLVVAQHMGTQQPWSTIVKRRDRPVPNRRRIHQAINLFRRLSSRRRRNTHSYLRLSSYLPSTWAQTIYNTVILVWLPTETKRGPLRIQCHS